MAKAGQGRPGQAGTEPLGANMFVDDSSVASPRCLGSVVQAMPAVAGFVLGMHHVLDDKTSSMANIWDF